jgi:flagellar biosynthesis/type III secretory pathway protein FliH
MTDTGTIRPSDAPVMARRVARQEFDRATNFIVTAAREASRIINDARAAADVMQKTSHDRAAALDARALALDDAAFRDSLDHENAKRRAKAFADVLDQAAQMRVAFDAVTPWLTDLVQTCLHKMIGTMDQGDVIAGIVTAALGDLKTRNGLALRVSAADVDAVQGVLAKFPARFAAISAVFPDATLAVGTIMLEGQGGFVDIGIAAQLGVLASHIATLIPAAGGAS